MADGVHKAYTDDGVTYCGWDGHDGCGHVWPCPTVRAYRAPPPVGNPDQSLIRSVLLYGTGFRWRRPDGEVLVLDPAEVDMFVAADMPETMAEAESRGRAAGYAEAVQRLRDDERYTHWWSQLGPEHPEHRYWDFGRKALADYLETVERLPEEPDRG